MACTNPRILLALLLALCRGVPAVCAEAVRVVPFDPKARATKLLSHRGQLVAGAHWFDGSGENLLLLTQTGAFAGPGADREARSAELYAYQYVKSARGWGLLWSLRDFERNCPFDLYAGFLPGSLQVSDLDHDGRAETSFLYTLSCRSDVSPATLKLILHEGKAKYAIRGTTRVQVSPGSHAGGAQVLDRQFLQAPQVFRKFAQMRWKRFVNEIRFEQF